MSPTQVTVERDRQEPVTPRWRQVLRNGWSAVGRRRDAWLVMMALVVIGASVTGYKLSLVGGIQHVGHADEAAYIHLARGLANGRGLTVDYVSWFFRPYSAAITRREDHWPPFVSLCAAPFVRVLGDEPWVYRVAPILIGSVLLPLTAAALGMAYSRRGYVGLAAGLLMLGNMSVFTDSLRVLSDVSLAMLVAGHLAALMAAARRPWLHIVAVLTAVLAYYAKGSQLILLGLYPVSATILGGFGIWRGRWIWCGLAAGLVALAPFWLGNYRAYGNPLHSTQNYVSGYMGITGWEEGTYPAYWGQNLPRMSDRWTKHAEAHRRVSQRNREALTRYAFLGPATSSKDWRALGTIGMRLERWLSARTPRKREVTEGECAPLDEWRDPRSALCGVTAVLFAAAVLATGVVVAPVRLGIRVWRWWRGQRPVPPDPAPIWPPLFRPTLVMLLICAVQWCFIVYLWEAQSRFAQLFLPVTAVLACTAASRLLELPLRFLCGRWLTRWQWRLGAVLAAVAVILFFARREQLIDYHRANARLDRYPYADQPFYPGLGNWFRHNLPDAVIMARNPWELLYHCSPTNKAVNVPLADAPTIFAIARYYRTTHYVADGRRPALLPYINGELPGLKPLTKAPGPVFEFQFDQLPGGTATVNSVSNP